MPRPSGQWRAARVPVDPADLDPHAAEFAAQSEALRGMSMGEFRVSEPQGSIDTLVEIEALIVTLKGMIADHEARLDAGGL